MVSERAYKLLETKIDGLKKEERIRKDANQRKTYDEVFDQITLMNIYKLIIDKVLDTLDFPISTGKEANVFKGTTPDGDDVAVKIYRVATATYRDFRKYIEGDPRFRNVSGSHRNLVYTWSKKEYANLIRMNEAGVRVPEAKKYLNNILVMEFIGDNKNAAPMLKDVELENPGECAEFIIESIEKLYKKCRLIHGDISEYNVLIPDDDMVIIDVGQSVVLEHPMAQELLVRDIKNLVRYFRKYNLKLDSNEILIKVTETDEIAGEGKDSSGTDTAEMENENEVIDHADD